MKKTFAVLLAVLFLAAAVIPIVSHGADAASEVSGRVNDGSAGKEGVRIVDADTSDVYATTDADGVFAFTLDGTVNVKFEMDGYGVSFCSLPGLAGNPGTYVLDPTTANPVTVTVHALAAVVNGTIWMMTDEKGDPFRGVSVIVDTEGADQIELTTGSDGGFTFSADKSKVYLLRFVKFSYGVTNPLPSGLTETSAGSGVWRLDLGGEASSSFAMSVLMSRVYGSLSGTVANDKGAGLSEVHVELSADGVVVANTTTRNGEYIFKNIPIGQYSVTMSRSDLEPQTLPVDVTESGSTLDFVARSKIPAYILGLDFPHSLMFIGAVLGIVTIALIVAYRTHIGRKARTGDPDEVFELDDDRDL